MAEKLNVSKSVIFRVVSGIGSSRRTKGVVEKDEKKKHQIETTDCHCRDENQPSRSTSGENLKRIIKKSDLD